MRIDTNGTPSQPEPRTPARATALRHPSPRAAQLPTEEDAEQQDLQEPEWYSLEIAERIFQVSTCRSPLHMQQIERLLAKTYTQLKANLAGHPPLHIAMLTAINLADQLVCQQQGREASETRQRMRSILSRLEETLAQGSD